MMRSLWLITFYCAMMSFNGVGESAIAIHYEGYAIQEFSDTELPFAAPIPTAGIKGVIVSADPPEACSNITAPPDLNSSLNWFVLIAGSSCDYETKLVYSELAGYSAAIIYNVGSQWHGTYRSRSGSLASSPNVSAVSIRRRSGLKIKQNYLFTINNSYSIYIYRNNTIDVTILLLIFAIVTGTFIVLMFAFMIIKFVQQVRSAHINRLSSRHLRQLPTCKFQKGDQYETCAICLEDYKDKDDLRILPCLHGYHPRCIDPWLLNNRRICPVCKQKVVLGGDSVTNEVESDTEDRAASTPLLDRISERHAAHGTFDANSELVSN